MLGYARVLNTTRGDLYENPLKVGDLVQFKSGGPVMVVTECGETAAQVHWTDKLGAPHMTECSQEILQRARRSFFGRRR